MRSIPAASSFRRLVAAMGLAATVVVLAAPAPAGVSNGGPEAINGVIEKTRRLAHGFRNFTNYRLRILLAADGTRPYRRHPASTPNHAELGRAGSCSYSRSESPLMRL